MHRCSGRFVSVLSDACWVVASASKELCTMGGMHVLCLALSFSDVQPNIDRQLPDGDSGKLLSQDTLLTHLPDARNRLCGPMLEQCCQYEAISMSTVKQCRQQWSQRLMQQTSLAPLRSSTWAHTSIYVQVDFPKRQCEPDDCCICLAHWARACSLSQHLRLEYMISGLLFGLHF